MEEASRYGDVYFIEDSEEKRREVSFKPVTHRIAVVRSLMPALIRFQRRRLPLMSRLWTCWHLLDLRRRYFTIVYWEAMNWIRGYRFMPHDISVHDSINPCFSYDLKECKAFEKRDRDVMKRADLVFASAELNADIALGIRCWRRVHLFNNACAPHEYDGISLAAAAKPGCWPAGLGAVAAYLRTLHWRFEFAFSACGPLLHGLTATSGGAHQVEAIHSTFKRRVEETNARIIGVQSNTGCDVNSLRILAEPLWDIITNQVRQ